jgi:organic radical activating enzyme
MFGKNEIVQSRYFDNLPEDVLKIVSMFLTLQGEGPFSGELAVFIRGAKCNLRCSFCDTYFDSGDDLTFTQIFDHIQKLIKEFYTDKGLTIPSSVSMRALLLVVSGGEPLLQKNLTNFLNQAHARGYRCQIESNGIVERLIHCLTHLVISAKVNERTHKYILPNAVNLERADTLKFVISDEMPGYTDIPEFALDWYSRHPDRNLYVSPMNMYINQPSKVGNNADFVMRSEVDERISFWTPNLMDPIKNQRNHEYAAYLAMKYGCKLSLQTHLYASLP